MNTFPTLPTDAKQTRTINLAIRDQSSLKVTGDINSLSGISVLLNLAKLIVDLKTTLKIYYVQEYFKKITFLNILFSFLEEENENDVTDFVYLLLFKSYSTNISKFANNEPSVPSTEAHSFQLLFAKLLCPIATFDTAL